MESSTLNTYCIEYWKPSNPADTKVLRRINKNGVPVSTRKFSEVFMYEKLQDAFPDAKELMNSGYNIKVRKCCLAREDEYFLI